MYEAFSWEWAAGKRIIGAACPLSSWGDTKKWTKYTRHPFFSPPPPFLQSVLIKHDLRSLEKIVINNEDQSGYCLALTRRVSWRRSRPVSPEALEAPINFTQMSRAPSIDLNGYSKWPRYLLFNHFLIRGAISVRWRQKEREEERLKRHISHVPLPPLPHSPSWCYWSVAFTSRPLYY